MDDDGCVAADHDGEGDDPGEGEDEHEVHKLLHNYMGIFGHTYVNKVY